MSIKGGDEVVWYEVDCSMLTLYNVVSKNSGSQSVVIRPAASPVPWELIRDEVLLAPP